MISFCGKIIWSVGSLSFRAENIFRCASVTFTLELHLLGRIWRVTGVVIRLLTMTASVAIWIVLYILVSSSIISLFSGIFAISMSIFFWFLAEFTFAVELIFCNKLLSLFMVLPFASLEGFRFAGGGLLSNLEQRSVDSGGELVDTMSHVAVVVKL